MIVGVVENVPHVAFEDGGRAMIATVYQSDPEGEDVWFVRVQSWSETRDHPLQNQLTGKTVRVTVEVID